MSLRLGWVLVLAACGSPMQMTQTPKGVPGGGGPLASGTGSMAKSAGTAPADAVAFSGGFLSSSMSGSVTFTIGGVARAVELYRPTSAAKFAPLVLVLHGTGGTPNDFTDDAAMQAVADANGWIVAGPQALQRNGGNGEPGDADHYEGSTGWATGWNMVDPNPDTNNDLQLLRAMIQSARTAFEIDSDRVYVAGFSNGAFFSYYVAAVMTDRIAAFAEMAGGGIRCANRDAPGLQFTGMGTTCAALAMEMNYPTCTGALKPAPVPTSGRIPLGFLAHATDDEAVSVAWTCTLGTALGNRSLVFLQKPSGMPIGHTVLPDFAANAAEFFKRYRRQD